MMPTPSEHPLAGTDVNAVLRLLDSVIGTPGTGRPLGLIVIHLENFGRLVSTVGYRRAIETSDRVLERIERALRPQDTVIRLNESRFTAVYPGIADAGHLELAANKIFRTLHGEPPDEALSRVNVRLGMALSPLHADDADRLLQLAETALLIAADEHRASFVYTADDPRNVMSLWDLEHDLDSALNSGELELYYQPKIGLPGGRPCGAEALMRWWSPTRGYVPPEVFVRVADETDRIEAMTWFALNTASRQCAQWPDSEGNLGVAVNITPNIIERSDVVRLAKNALGLWNLDPERLTIELTEGALIHHPENSRAVLNELRDHGIRVAIDDFGTGYSSLAYFKNVPADELKIDKSFVRNMLNDDADARIVRTVVSLAHAFGLEVTAEGVEDEPTARALADLGCDYLQGYLFSRPISQQDFCGWLATNRGGA